MFKKIQLYKKLTTKKDTEENQNTKSNTQSDPVSQIFKGKEWVTPQDSSSSSGSDTPQHNGGESL